MPADEVWTRLGLEQASRHARLSAPDAQRFLAGRALLAQLLAEFTDRDDLGFTTTCERCGADHGRPRLAHVPVAVSVSYAGSMVAVAAVSLHDAAAVGIDIELVPSEGASAPLRELSNLFDAATPPDTTGWTLLEAAVKADGRGIRIDLAGVQIGEPSTGRMPGSRAVRLPGHTDPMDAAVIEGPDGFVLSVALGYAPTTD